MRALVAVDGGRVTPDLAQRQRRHVVLPRAARARRRAGLDVGAARRRGRGLRRAGPHRLRPPAVAHARRPARARRCARRRPVQLLRLRRAAPRGRVAARPDLRRAAGRPGGPAAWPGAPGRCRRPSSAAAPRCSRPPRAQGLEGVVAKRATARLPAGPAQRRLAQAQARAPHLRGGRRLAARARAAGPAASARCCSAVHGRGRAGVRRPRRHRLHGRHARRCSARGSSRCAATARRSRRRSPASTPAPPSGSSRELVVRGGVHRLDPGRPPAPPVVQGAARRRAPPRRSCASEPDAQDRRGRRGAAGRPVQPRQGALPGGRLHQGAGARLLHAHRAGAAAAPGRPGADPQALPRRRRGAGLLREERPARHARLGAHRDACRRPARARAARRSTTSSSTTWPRWCGPRTSPASSCTPTCGGSTASSPRPASSSTSTRDRRRRSSSAAGWRCCCAPLLEADGLGPFAKTSGSKGLQLYARADGSDAPASRPRRTPRALAQRLEKEQPGPRRAPDDQGAARRQGARRLVAEQRRPRRPCRSTACAPASGRRCRPR